MNPREKLIQELVEDGYLKTPRIIEALRKVDRADFVKPEYLGEAYGNYPLPIGEGQTVSQPLTVAFILELLDPRPGEKILDIGSGSGWTTALLANVIGRGRVFGIERIGELCDFGKKNLAKYFDESQAKIICGDGTLGLSDETPFDKILAGAAASREIPQAWRDQLKVGGRIVAPVGGSVWLFIKKSPKEWEEKEFPGFSFVPLISGADPHKKSNIYAAGARKLGTTGYWLLACFIVAAFFTNEVYRPHTAFSGSKSVEIPQGLGSRKIAELLKEEGLIRSKSAFITYASLKGGAARLKPGSYVFSGRDSIPDIFNTLVLGGTNEVVLVIPEGWNSREIAERLNNLGLASGEELLFLVQHRELNKFDFLRDRPADAGLEGYLFPDTYRVFKNSTAEEIVLKLLENFGKKLTLELRKEIARREKTIFEIITMASLVEKEVSSDEDRALVSGILWKRLRFGMALQVDATITYITGKKTTRISREETQIDSPYNTYKYPGLPKGPIANPGLSAVKAAIYPQESPYLYYLSTLDGQTIFSKTLEEHNAAKARYLR